MSHENFPPDGSQTIEPEYLGDGAYAGLHPRTRDLVLWTSNGEEATNVIFLESPVVMALLRYMKRMGWM